MKTIGRYKILRKLATGGFGRTYLAEHTLLGCRVVVKQALLDDPDAQGALRDEARLLYEVRHWALPTVKDVLLGRAGEFLVVMSYVEGDELMHAVQRDGHLDPETCCWIAQRVLAALHYLHYSGIVHRDVKPANIIVDWATHNAVLVDFGLASARPTGADDRPGYTPLFGAPEQLALKPALPESDIYGLGMTMLYVLGGNLRTKRLPASVPEELADFIRSLIRIDPNRRPGCCDSLNTELSRLRRRIFGRVHSG